VTKENETNNFALPDNEAFVSYVNRPINEFWFPDLAEQHYIVNVYQ
jgi:hypothetical protein